MLYVPDEARLSHLVGLPEGHDLGAAVDAAMRAIETHNPELKDVLPKGYQRLEKSTLVELLRLFAPLPRNLAGDAFGLIYEDFLSNFAMAEGRLGGEFFTPYSIVRLIVEIIEPFHGRVFDPACGSGGMFVQCAKFVERHRGSATAELSVYGQEQKESTVPIAKMNLALHGLSGDVRLGNSYYDDLHHSRGSFDFVMANPPFNVNGVDKSKLEGDKRVPVRDSPARQRQLPLDPALLLVAWRRRPGRVRHGQLGWRRPALGAGHPSAAHRVEERRRDGGYRVGKQGAGRYPPKRCPLGAPHPGGRCLGLCPTRGRCCPPSRQARPCSGRCLGGC